MALRFEDFAPQVTEERFFTGRHFESLDAALEAMNLWIAESGVRVVNVETVVLPSMWDEEGTRDPQLRSSGEFTTAWHQFFRVWYQD